MAMISHITAVMSSPWKLVKRSERKDLCVITDGFTMTHEYIPAERVINTTLSAQVYTATKSKFLLDATMQFQLPAGETEALEALFIVTSITYEETGRERHG